MAAVQQGRAIKFPYRKLGEPSPVERHVEPWGVVSWRGRWYLVGFDRTRQAERVFRLSRVTGAVRAVGKAGAVTVPSGTDLRALVSESYPMERTLTATLLVRPGTGHSLRRFGRVVRAAVTAAESDTIEIDYSDTERMARWVVGHGPDVLVAAPAGLRREVVRRLRSALGEADPASTSTPTSASARAGARAGAVPGQSPAVGPGTAPGKAATR